MATTTLDPAALEEAHSIVSEAVDRYKPAHVFGLFSGGHDSLCACHVASLHDSFSGVVHINTGIGIEETRDYVRDTSRAFGWKLREYHPPESYESLVVAHGFPGPAHHYKMYQRLKERCLRQLFREHSPNTQTKIVLVSGRRKQESQRRMVTVEAPISVVREPTRRAVWANPLISWTGEDKRAYMRLNDLPSNPVVDRLCMSGECLCGAFAKPGELDEIRTWYPNAAKEIDRITDLARRSGVHCRWGHRPARHRQNGHPMQLCFSCMAKGD